MLLCDHCRKADRADCPVEVLTIVMGTLLESSEASVHLCPECRARARSGFEVLVADLRAGQRPLPIHAAGG